MIVNVIRTLDKQNLRLFDLAKLLQITPIKTIEIISKVNAIENNLIAWENGLYVLTRKINFLDENIISSQLKEKNLKYKTIILNEIDSTNSYALNNITNFDSPTIISCELQNSGKGRFGKTWTSKLAYDITMTIVYQLPTDINLSIVPLAAAVAINKVLKTYNIYTRIKWPNDIYLNNNKICGILVENVLRNEKNNVVVGIGLDNISNIINRNQIIVDILDMINNIILEYNKNGSKNILSEWLDNCIHYNQQISLTKDGKHIISGIHSGIGKDGEIFITNADKVYSFNSSAYSLNFFLS